MGPRVGAHICLNLGVGLDRILHHTAKYLRVVARLPLAIYISAWGAFLTCNTACSYAPAHAFVVPIEMIRMLGDWKSNSVLLYLTVPLRIRLQSTNILTKHLMHL